MGLLDVRQGIVLADFHPHLAREHSVKEIRRRLA